MDLRKNRSLFNGDFGCLFWNAEIWRGDQERYSAAAIYNYRYHLAAVSFDWLAVVVLISMDHS